MALSLSDGRSLQVIYPGRHTFDHGPDFRDALLAFDNDLVRGDIELHVRSSDWRSHGHCSDAHYNRVVLHVVWHDDRSAASTEAGGLLPVLALSPLLVPGEQPLNKAEEDPVNTPCFVGRGSQPGPEAIQTLTEMGEQRLLIKSAAFEADLTISQGAEIFYAALLEGLGYTGNRKAFRALAELVPWQVAAASSSSLPDSQRVSFLEALFFGSAGLLPHQRKLKRTMSQEDALYAGQLENQWRDIGSLWRILPLQASAWRFGRVRPENFPTRRLAAAARLFAPYVAANLPAVFLGILRSEDLAEVPLALEQALSISASGYWSTHYDFGGKTLIATKLLGRNRAADLVLNVILPFAIAYGEAYDDPYLATMAKQAVRDYPALAENELTRYMAGLIFDRRPKGIAAIQQQGLLHAYHRYCREKRCAECPLSR